MSKYSTANKKVFERVLAKKKAEIETLAVSAMNTSSSAILLDIDRWSSWYYEDCKSSPYLPKFTGKLFYNTGVGVYSGAMLRKYNQGGGSGNYLASALSGGLSYFKSGLGMAVMSAVPYAVAVQEGYGDYNPNNKRANAGYWDRIVDSTKSIVRTNVKISFPKNYQ